MSGKSTVNDLGWYEDSATAYPCARSRQSMSYTKKNDFFMIYGGSAPQSE